VTVRSVDITERDEIVAICARGRLRQAIPILDLVLPFRDCGSTVRFAGRASSSDFAA
jgi:hypothetical protein